MPIFKASFDFPAKVFCFGNIIKTLCTKFYMIKINFYVGINRFSKNHPNAKFMGSENCDLEVLSSIFLHVASCNTNTL